MPGLPRQQPFHEPIGTSPEDVGFSRRWLLTLVSILAVLVAGGVALYGLTG